MLAKQFVGCVPRIGRFASNQFVQHAAHGVDIASLVQVVAANLFGRHVRTRSLLLVLRSKKLSQPCPHFSRNREVDELDFKITAQQQIIWLDIAMDVTF